MEWCNDDNCKIEDVHQHIDVFKKLNHTYNKGIKQHKYWFYGKGVYFDFLIRFWKWEVSIVYLDSRWILSFGKRYFTLGFFTFRFTL